MKRIQTSPSISLILPCYNEEASIAACVLDAKKVLAPYIRSHRGEIIVVDNNSTDLSARIAKQAGAKVVKQPILGYGAALNKGFTCARGDILIMADADRTYPLSYIPAMIRDITKSHADLVIGSRFLGTITPGAMPWFNQHIGNPMLTGLLNIFYQTSISDTQSGYRAITKSAYQKLDLMSDGMEFASEMIIKSIAHRLKITEIPITYRVRTGTSKLSPIRDAVRHMLSLFFFSPTYAFFIPGVLLILGASVALFFLIPGPLTFGTMEFGTHSQIAAVFMFMSGMQCMLLGIVIRRFTAEYLGIPGGMLTAITTKYIREDRLAILGVGSTILGFLGMGSVTFGWIRSGFGVLARTGEFMISTTLVIIGNELLITTILLWMLTYMVKKRQSR